VLTLGVTVGLPVGLLKENHGLDVGFGVILGVTVGVMLIAVFDLGREIPLKLNFPLATMIKTATTTSPKMKERALLN